MSSQSHDLHRALLRPAIIHTLRAAGFHSTKPSVLDVLTNLAERHLMLLASSTAAHAQQNHNDPAPSVTDVRMALAESGVLTPCLSSAEENWRENMRRPLAERGESEGRKRKRDEEDVRDVRAFEGWFDSAQYREIKRVAGMIKEDAGLVVGVGGGVVHGEDFLATLKKKFGKVGDEARLQGTVLGVPADEREGVIEGGPAGNLKAWRPSRASEERRGTQVLEPGPVDRQIGEERVPPDRRLEEGMAAGG